LVLIKKLLYMGQKDLKKNFQEKHLSLGLQKTLKWWDFNSA